MALDGKFFREDTKEKPKYYVKGYENEPLYKIQTPTANTTPKTTAGGAITQPSITAQEAYKKASTVDDTKAPEWLTPRSTGTGSSGTGTSGSGSGSTSGSGSSGGSGRSRRSSGGSGYTAPTITVPTVPETPTTPIAETITTEKVTVPNTFQWGDLTIDLNHDYESDYLNATSDADRKVIEQFRNAKLQILNYLNQNPGGYEITDRAQDYDLANNAVAQAQYANIIKQLEAQRQAQIDAEQQKLAAANEQYGLQQKQAEQERNAELRQQYIDEQLALKDLEEILAAQGVSGGDINSAILDARTAYAQNYANAQDAYNKQIADILAKQNSMQSNIAENTAAIRATYGDRIADAYAQKASNQAQAEAQAFKEIASRLGYM